MKGIALALALAGPMALPAAAEDILSPDTSPDPTTCAQFTAMDAGSQVQTLSTMPIGDEIDAADQAAAAQFAGSVAEVCAGHPDRKLFDAASEAMGGD